jgi:3-dehydroquinate synthase
LQISGITGNSTIVVGERLDRLSYYVPMEKLVIVTDHVVRQHYARYLPACEIIEIGTGEGIKTLATVESIYRQLLKIGADRSFFLVAIGGGIVCDVTGFVASTFLRGLRFGFVPSSLLSQVDAGVGGKNGVNVSGYKNMVGVFRQPEFVICDTALLRTLPEREVLCGLAEVVKHAAIADAALFSYLERNVGEIKALKRDVMEKIVYDSVAIKAAVVQRDEKEGGERRKLNFGHTFGHAIEKTAGLPHGEAVSIGMSIASSLSEKWGYLPGRDRERIVHLLDQLGLPTAFDGGWEEVMAAVGKDKKREGDTIHLVLLSRIGQSFVEDVPIENLGAAQGCPFPEKAATGSRRPSAWGDTGVSGASTHILR